MSLLGTTGATGWKSVAKLFSSVEKVFWIDLRNPISPDFAVRHLRGCSSAGVTKAAAVLDLLLNELVHALGDAVLAGMLTGSDMLR